MASKGSLKKIKISNILLLTLAGIVNAIGVVMFLAPVQLFDSGFSGTAMLISAYTPSWLSLSAALIILNIPVFLFGQKKQGTLFTFYAIYTVLIYSFFAWLISDVLPIDVSIASPLAKSDLFLCAIFGGVISGIGSGLAVRFGGAMDGIDILGILFAKNIGISLGNFVLVYNIILYIICGLMQGSWILPLYSIVAYVAASKMVDFCVEGFDSSKAAYIITDKSEDVCNALAEVYASGITILAAKGYYSGQDKSMIYFVANRFQISRMRSIVHSVDPKAYISIIDVSDIFPANT